MNQAQRKFLIDKITKKVDLQIKALNDNKPEYPSLSNYLFSEILSGKLTIKSKEQILESLKKQALKSKGSDWLDGDKWGGGSLKLKIDVREIVNVPENWEEQFQEYLKKSKDIEEKIKNLSIQRETLEIRIQLASDKTLANMINEVDDMGDLSLVDTKLKMLLN